MHERVPSTGIALLAGLLVACGRTPPPPVAGLGATAPAAALLAPSAASDAATTEGVLRLSPGCVRVRQPDGRYLLPAFLLRPVRWDPVTRRLRAGPHAFADGDRVLLGGSAASAGALQAHWTAPPAAHCRFDTLWVTGTIAPG